MNDIAVVEQNQTNSVLAVISRAATDTNVDIGKMERLLDMQERVMAKDAEMAFYSDMSELQDEMPTIKKEGAITVNGSVRSRYARFEDILGQTKHLLKKYGFSVAFKSNFVEGQLEITGTLSHRQGHHESTTMRLPFDDSGAKNSVQQIGSSVSYGKRYVYCMLLNINITEDDDDGNAADPKNTLEAQFERLLKHNDQVCEWIDYIASIKTSLATDDYSGAYETYAQIDKESIRALWVAPTKGGIFTTKERAQMKSNEWNDASMFYHSVVNTETKA
jgi:hypothetical protein